MNNQIIDSINKKRVIEIYYDGGLRKIEPHCYGITTAGNQGLRAYQTEGHSASGERIGWKMFDLSKASNLKILDIFFLTPRPGYKRNDMGMSRIFAQL